MNSRLLLLIDEHWPSRPSLPWVLVDEAGRKVSEGESEPRHWPAAAECAVVLAGTQCAWHRTRLPRGARREETRLLAYALEDRLLRDPDSQHLSVVDRDPVDGGVEVGVLVVARERLRTLVAQLAAIGRPPVALCAELQCAPAGADGWHIALTRGGVILRTGPRDALCFDPPFADALPMLQHALAVARAQNRPPETVTVHPAPGEAAPDPELLTLLGDACGVGAGYEWWANAARANNLLHGEFAPRHARASWAGRLRWPLRLGAASLAVLLLADLGDVIWKRQRLDGLEARMTRVFETSVPGTPAIAPAAQLRRQLDEFRTRHGRLREDDLLALFAAYGEARGVAARDSIDALKYRDGRLELTVPRLDARARVDLPSRLAALGLVARSEGDPPRLTIAAEVTR